MARILAISSHVAYGHVGLAAIVPALQALGHEVIAVPTVVLSSHYGYNTVNGVRLDAGQVGGIVDALVTNGWLETADAVLTGYMPSVEVAEGVARVLGRLGETNPEILYLCDPVIGDDPHGLYVPEGVAVAIRDGLVPLADIVTPNRFELEWLSGMPVRSAADADLAAEEVGADLLVATSVPAGEGLIANVFSDEESTGQAVHKIESKVPHGSGDLFAALLLGYLLDGFDNAEAVARASAGIRTVIEASLGEGELQLIESLDEAISVDPAGLSPVT